MKFYMHPVSKTCRPIRLFAADNNIAMDEVLVDLMTGAHMQPEYAAINPNCLVPMLEDGDLKLTESSAILKYLADKIGDCYIIFVTHAAYNGYLTGKYCPDHRLVIK